MLAEQNMSASLVYTLVMKLEMHYLAEYVDDSPTLSVICVLPWTTALHLARPTPLPTHSWHNGDEAVEVISVNNRLSRNDDRLRKKRVSPPYVKVHI